MTDLRRTQSEEMEDIMNRQGEAILAWLEQISSTGDLNLPLNLPPGNETLRSVGNELRYLIEDFREMLVDQEAVNRGFETQINGRSRYFESPKPPSNGVSHRPKTDSTQPQPSARLPRSANRLHIEEDGLKVPIPVGDDVIGMFEFDGIAVDDIDPNDLQAIIDISEQVGLALENQRLFDKTQEALSEVESLYSASIGFNHATTVEDVLITLLESFDYSNPTGAAYWGIQEETDSYWIILEALFRRSTEPSMFNLGAQFDMNNYSIKESVFGANPSVVLLGDPATDPALKKDENLTQIMNMINLKAIGFIPLTIGSQITGLITIHWQTPYKFTPRDQQFLQTMLYHAAPAIQTIKLLEQTRSAARQAERISKINADLSQSESDSDVIGAITETLQFPEGYTVTLAHIYTENLGIELTQDTEYQTQAIYRGGEDITQDLPESFYLRLPISENPLSEVWQTPDESIFYIADIDNDAGMTDGLKAVAAEIGWKSAIYIPLFSNNRWQGLITVTSPIPNSFSEESLNALQRISESASAVVATMRAREAQLDAQLQAEFLYQIGSRINQASVDVNEIMSVVGEILPSDGGINKATLLMFDIGPTDRESTAEVYGNWWNGAGTPPSDIGTYYTFDRFPSIAFMLSREVGFVNDTFNDPMIDANMREVFKRLDMRTMGILPLWVGDRQIGAVVLQGNDPHNFSQSEIDIFKAILPQLSVAVQNQVFLSEARQRANTERILREVTEKVQNAPTVDMVMKTAVQEVGRLLGRKTLIYFNDSSSNSDGGPV